ncbi:tRNA synthetases class I, catalytic domain-containing protein [Zopfochytrium polystomum]|nr:tRNA synthetases class I, catalytic domain-containing protein [Zopfochytrium polystomum]
MESLFAGRLGLNTQQSKELAAHKKSGPLLAFFIEEADAASIAPTELLAIGSLLSALAVAWKKDDPALRPKAAYVARAIFDARLKSVDQITAAVKFAESAKGEIDSVTFDAACGVGVVVTPEEISAAVAKVIKSKKEDLDKKYWAAQGPILGVLRTELRWANSALVKEEVDKQLLALLGPKDAAPKEKKEAAKPTAAAASTAQAAPLRPPITELAKSFKYVFEGQLAALHKPGGNPQIKESLMKEHLARTGGKVVTRFPPEPNGFLHIGHAKAININFGYAQAHKGITYLRYDDTNPEAEEEKYFTSILDMVNWLGFEPHAVTYSSDHFQRLYDLAVELIKRDKAYVCHCTGAEIHEMRGGDAMGERSECSHRNRPIEESVREFKRMKDGEYGEGEAILRMKMDMFNPSPQFWDLVAYRVMFTRHHRSGDQWCIYPTYDYTHCLCDSFEDITHSLCTTEFQLSRESYYWLVDALELYKPVQWEYGRLNLTYAILSKRKLLKLVNEGHVRGWDDPRLYTLIAVRRRGFTPEAINAFVRDIGVTTANTVIPVERLENYVRDHLNEVAERRMAILNPLKVTLSNLPANHRELVAVANNPLDKSAGDRKVPFTKTIYIDASDFRESAGSEFYRLSLGKSVGLLQIPHPIIATKVVKDDRGNVVEVVAEYDTAGKSGKPKAYIQWVADSPKDKSPVRVEVRNYGQLFKHPNPMDKKLVPDGWLSDINKNSLEVLPDAMVDIGVLSAKVEDRFQFLRLGYYCVDPDSDVAKGKFVFNRTVSLKEDAGKS